MVTGGLTRGAPDVIRFHCVTSQLVRRAIAPFRFARGLTRARSSSLLSIRIEVSLGSMWFTVSSLVLFGLGYLPRHPHRVTRTSPSPHKRLSLTYKSLTELNSGSAVVCAAVSLSDSASPP